jgi:hypothetical protein
MTMGSGHRTVQFVVLTSMTHAARSLKETHQGT